MEHTVRVRPGLRLRKVGSHYMIVEACRTNVNMSDVFSLNETAAGLWQRIAGGVCTAEELAAWLCSEYRVDGETALRDVRRQLDEWREYGLLEQQEPPKPWRNDD